MPESAYPNRLAEAMAQAKVNDPQLAALVGTSKQQIFKLRTGQRELTPTWARRIAEHLGGAWHELIEHDQSGPSASALTPMPGWGARIAAFRQAVGAPAGGFAERAGVSTAQLVSLEAERASLTLSLLLALKQAWNMSADWVLFEEPDGLSPTVLQRMVNAGGHPGAPASLGRLRQEMRRRPAPQPSGPTLHDEQPPLVPPNSRKPP